MALYIFMCRVYAFIVSLKSFKRKRMDILDRFCNHLDTFVFWMSQNNWKYTYSYNFLTGFPINYNNMNSF